MIMIVIMITVVVVLVMMMMMMIEDTYDYGISLTSILSRPSTHGRYNLSFAVSVLKGHLDTLLTVQYCSFITHLAILFSSWQLSGNFYAAPFTYRESTVYFGSWSTVFRYNYRADWTLYDPKCMYDLGLCMCLWSRVLLSSPL